MFLQKTLIQNNTKLFRVSDFLFERAHMSFCYIGIDLNTFEHFKVHFESGYQEKNFFQAGNLLNELYDQNSKLPDVIFIDVPLNVEELNQFSHKLKYNIHLGDVPVIYIENQLNENEIHKLNQLKLIDDIIAINSGQIDYLSKVMFIKQSKIYNLLTPPSQWARKNHPELNFFFYYKTDD